MKTAMADTPFPTSGSLYIERPSDDLARWLAGELAEGEAVVGLLPTDTEAPGLKATWWLLATDRRSALVAFREGSDDGGHTMLRAIPEGSVATRERKLTKERFLLDGEVVFAASRLGHGALRRLFELAVLPGPRRLLEAALDHLRDGRLDDADALLTTADDALRMEGEVEQGSLAYLSVHERVLLRRSEVAVARGDEPQAIALLAELSAARPQDDLLEVATRLDALDRKEMKGWWTSLAVAHEEAGDFASAARVYAQLAGANPGLDAFLRSEARSLRRAGELEASAEAYDRFVAGRAARGFDPSVWREQAVSADDDDFVAACLESAEILQELGRHDEAAERYLLLIRRAPFFEPAYAHLFALADRVPEAAFTIGQAADVLRLLRPGATVTIERAASPPVALPAAWTPVSDEDHDTRIVHPAERQTASLAQRLIGRAIREERDTRDIRHHAQQVTEASHPEVAALLTSIAALLEVEAPPVFLSHGASGVDVLGRRDPLILLGARHLDPESPRHLAQRPLCFALATQLEHVRARHLMLTSSEFWRTFGAKSATTLLALLPMGDLVGKFTDNAVLRWLERARSSAQNAALKRLLDLAERRVVSGEGREGIQAAYAATLAKLHREAVESDDADDSLVKEGLSVFARAARYTGDRAGLLACDSLPAAVEAILRLSPAAEALAEAVGEEGLGSTVGRKNDEGELVHHELALRIGELFRFALSDDYRALRVAVAPTAGR